MTMVDVRLKIPLGQVRSATTGTAVTGSTVGAHEDRSEAGLFDADGFLLAARADLEVFRAGTAQAEDVLAGDHAAVDEDRLVALIADVDHRIEDLFADQVHLVVPV